MFINAFLWPFLLLASVPILLHLLSLRRLPTVELSTFRFLFDTYVQQRRKMKLLEYLLLLLRVLFLIVLGLALMRPRLVNWTGLFGGGRDIAVLMDCSASMNLRTAGVTSLERAKEAARAILDRLPAGDRVTLFRLTHHAEPLAAQFTTDSPELRAAIQSLKPSLSHANLHAGLLAASEIGSAATPKTTYLFTDQQRSGWKQALEAGGGLLGTNDRLFVINVGNKQPESNRAVLGDVPRESDAVVGQPIELIARVANFSSAPAQMTLRMEMNGQVVDRFDLRLGLGDTTTRRATFVPTQAGPIIGSFAIDGDAFEADDQFQFVVNVSPQVRVLLINGKPSDDPFQDELLYLRAALRSRHSQPSDNLIGLTTLDSSSLLLEEVRDGEWTADRLIGQDVVILANARQMSQRHAADLKKFVENGGGLLVFPGDQVQDRYEELLGRARRDRLPILPLVFHDAEGDPNRQDRWNRISAVDYGHPALAIFRPRDGQEYLTTPKFYRHFRIQIAEDSRDCFPLAQFSNQHLALVEGRFGKGTVIVAAFPINSHWSTFPLVGADFVPMMLRLVSYVRRKPVLSVPSEGVPGQALEITVAERLEEPVVNLKRSTGEESRIPLVKANGFWAGKISETNDQGVHRVHLDARDPAPMTHDGSQRRIGEDRRVHSEVGFAVNPSSEESDFTAIEAQKITDVFGERATVIDLSQTTGGIAEEFSDKNEIWRWLMLILAAVFTAEFFLATLRGPRSAAERAELEAEGGFVTRMTGVKTMESEPLS